MIPYIDYHVYYRNMIMKLKIVSGDIHITLFTQAPPLPPSHTYNKLAALVIAHYNVNMVAKEHIAACWTPV